MDSGLFQKCTRNVDASHSSAYADELAWPWTRPCAAKGSEGARGLTLAQHLSYLHLSTQTDTSSTSILQPRSPPKPRQGPHVSRTVAPQARQSSPAPAMPTPGQLPARLEALHAHQTPIHTVDTRPPRLADVGPLRTL